MKKIFQDRGRSKPIFLLVLKLLWALTSFISPTYRKSLRFYQGKVFRILIPYQVFLVYEKNFSGPRKEQAYFFVSAQTSMGSNFFHIPNLQKISTVLSG